MTQTAARAAVNDELLSRFRDRADTEGLLDVAFTTMDSPVGLLLLAATRKGLVEIAYTHKHSVEKSLRELAAKLSPRILEAPRRLDTVRQQLDAYFVGKRDRFELSLDRSLMSDFGRRVLGRTEQIPYGEVSTYGDVAIEIGAPRAARAVGNALGANPIPIVIPCHRVLRAGLLLGGYGGGTDRKAWLLKRERAFG
jgi:methylated-DNA-[protein]-cysteine S-methyltransferase